MYCCSCCFNLEHPTCSGLIFLFLRKTWIAQWILLLLARIFWSILCRVLVCQEWGNGAVRKGDNLYLDMLELGSVGMVVVCLLHQLHWATGQQFFWSGWWRSPAGPLGWACTRQNGFRSKCALNWLVHCYPELLINCVIFENIAKEPFKRAAYSDEYNIKCHLTNILHSASASRDSGNSESLFNCNWSLGWEELLFF